MSHPDHPHARLSPEEQRARLTELERVRRKLTAEEAALLGAVFPAIVHDHYDAVTAFLRRSVAEADVADMRQKTFIAFHGKLMNDGFMAGRAKLVIKIAYGVVLNHRKGKRREPVSLGLPTSSSEPPRSPPDLGRLLDRERALAWLLPQLPDEQRQVLELSLADLSPEEIAAMLDIPLGTVKWRLTNGKRRLLALAETMSPPSEVGKK